MTDPWAVLGLPRRLTLDDRELSERHRDLSRRFHPDLVATGSEEERRSALASASAVNEAYRILRDREARAHALLALEGVASRAGTPPTEMLTELFDLNLELEEAADRSDRDEVARIAIEVAAERRSIDARLDAAFRDWDGASDDASRYGALREIQRELDRQSYWRSLDRLVQVALEPGP